MCQTQNCDTQADMKACCAERALCTKHYNVAWCKEKALEFRTNWTPERKTQHQNDLVHWELRGDDRACEGETCQKDKKADHETCCRDLIPVNMPAEVSVDEWLADMGVNEAQTGPVEVQEEK